MAGEFSELFDMLEQKETEFSKIHVAKCVGISPLTFEMNGQKYNSSDFKFYKIKDKNFINEDIGSFYFVAENEDCFVILEKLEVI